MRRIPTAALAVFTLAIGALATLGTAETSSSAAPAASPSPAKKDPCGATKSKWAHVQCQQFNNSAPGDEYFGRMKISYLGIDNTFRDGVISAGAYTTDDRLISKLMFADEALQRWAAKYPGDPQLARSYFLGIQVLRKVYTQPGQQLAWHYMQMLVTKYPTTYFGKTMKASLAKGFTEHWFANALPCPTPLPKGAMPQATPNATATPSPAPGQPAVQIIDPPCVKATPTPSPEPSGSLAPGASPAPSATPRR
ncbi:MAG TPA: hypothetical protein VGF86_10025 [Candidatus Tumulicola sp.]|jgi:hypothetical protein